MVMTVGEVIAAVTERGGNFRIDGQRIGIVPEGVLTDIERSILRENRVSALAILRLSSGESLIDYAAKMLGASCEPTADELLDKAERLGADLFIRSNGDIGIRNGDRLSNDIIRRLAQIHDRMLTALKRREYPTLSGVEYLCVRCETRQQCYFLNNGRTVCSRCAEWECRPPHPFTLSRDLEESVAQRYGCCLACGGSWEIHGRPILAEWVRTSDYLSVGAIITRFVLVTADSLLVDDEA